MTTRTTSHLSIAPLDRALLWLRWHRARLLYAVVALGWLLAALGARQALLGRPVQPQAIVATPALPITTMPLIVIQRAPTLAPVPTSTPDTRVLEELAALREQVAQLQAAQPAPQIIYQVVNAPAEAAPTVDAAQYQVTNTAPTMAPQTAAILDRQAWAAQAQEHKERP